MTDSETALELPPRKNSYDYDDLIASGHGKLFGPTNGRLPKPNMLMLDRITLIDLEHPQKVAACTLEPAQVIGVVDDAHGIRVTVNDPVGCCM